MKVLVACEESQAVCKAFREKGHEAYSCDIQECSGGHPEWHIKGDVLPIIDGYCTFTTMSDVQHQIDQEWDLIVAHPPCTDLACSGARWFEKKRADGRQQQSIAFFMRFAKAKCKRIAIENPVGIMSNVWRKPDQIIQPYQFGHHCRKTTCLWLIGLPKLVPTDIVDPGVILPGGYSVGASANYAKSNGKILRWNDALTSKIRSKTFSGIAKAMAEQWEVK